MTRIITITSGLAGVGKTHLAINLAAELVRKGRLTGLYHDDSGHASIDRLLQLSRNSAPKSTPDSGDVLCHGYQGIDVISSRYPLAGWNGLDGRQLDILLSAHEAWTGYDDFIIDTSGMSPRGVVACCLLSQPVLLVVTPESRSQAEAFALLKVLQLNDFSSPVFLVINNASATDDVSGIHDRLAEMAEQHLGLEIPLLGTVASDDHVMSAQRLHQAFTSVFPEATASGDIVKLADAMMRVQSHDVAGANNLAGFWKALVHVMRTPVHLAGNTDLSDYDQQEPPLVVDTVTPAEPVRTESTLLRYEGPMVRLDSVMESFSGVMHVMADDMLAFYDRLLDMDDKVPLAESPAVNNAAALEQKLAIILRVLKEAIGKQQKVCVQVEENSVAEDDEDWLRPGHYIKYAFLVPAEDDALAQLTREMEHLPGLRHNKGEDGECICEVISTLRDVCLSVVHTPQGEIRIHYWHAPEQDAGVSASQPVSRSLDHHPAHKRVH
ncbi:MAG: P-loop NTPase [Pseudomonadota bacterium]